MTLTNAPTRTPVVDQRLWHKLSRMSSGFFKGCVCVCVGGGGGGGGGGQLQYAMWVVIIILKIHMQLRKFTGGERTRLFYLQTN